MTSINNDWDLSICGLNCVKCDIYLASHGDEVLQQELLSWFKENVDPNIANISCEKCRGPTNKCWSDDCKMRSCSMKRKITHCFECPDFVCDLVEEFVSDEMDHHKRTVENMKKAKELGLKKWISLQKEPQYCP
jgi:hypothetical protein